MVGRPRIDDHGLRSELRLRSTSLVRDVSAIRLPAARALRTRGFRIAAVHFWQGNWNYDFWSNLDVDVLAADFARIRALGFNAIVLDVPWGEFQSRAMPPVHDEHRFAQLEALLTAAAASGLYAALRTGTAEWLPEGIDGGNYCAPFVGFDDRELGALADLWREVARRTAHHDNLLFLFASWEDCYGHAMLGRLPPEQRQALRGRTGPFFAALRERPIEHWNARWGTGFASVDEVQYPDPGSPAWAELLRWADARQTEHLLPRLAAAARSGDPEVRLGFEVRIDLDRVRDRAGRPSWFSHEATWRLPAGFDTVLAYFNPSWHAPNVGDTIAPRRCLANLRRLVRQLLRGIGSRRLFVDQFNFVDTTPAFRRNTRLADEDAIAQFVHDGLDLLLRRTLGYAIWSLDAYEANLLVNSRFRDGLRGFCAIGLVEVRAGGVVLHAGSSIEQAVHAEWNPGNASPEVPFTVRLHCRQGAVRVRFEPLAGEDPPHERIVHAAAGGPEEWRWPWCVAFRLSIAAVGGPAQVAAVAIFNHVQEAALFDPRGRPLGRRAEVVAACNRRFVLPPGT